MTLPLPPHIRVPIASGQCSDPWYTWFQQVQRVTATSVDVSGLSDDISGIATALGSPDGTVENIPAQTPASGTIIGLKSIRTYGQLPNLVKVELDGDLALVGSNFHYGTNTDSERGWSPVVDAFEAGNTLNLTLDGYVYLGELAAITNLPVSGTSGEVYRIDGDLYEWDGAAWVDLGPPVGMVGFELKPLADTATGTFKLLTRDTYGRLSGTKDGTTSDVPEGTNLYYTDVRARAATIAATITDGDTTHAPSGDAVFDALAGKASAMATAAQGAPTTDQLITNGAFQHVTLDSESFDYGAFFDPATSRFTPPAGLYLFAAVIAFARIPGASPPAGKRMIVALYKNGIREKQYTESTHDAPTNLCETVGFTVANGTDYFELYARHDTGLADLYSLAADTRLAMARIGGI